MMTMCERSIEELRLAGFFDEDSDYGGAIGSAVKELLEVFSKQGHSGYSAAVVSDLFYRLTKGEVLSPITSNPDEWCLVSEGSWQNTRDFRIFSTDAGKTWYNIDDCLFTIRDGMSLYTVGSMESITDPRDIVEWPKCNTCKVKKTCERRKIFEED